MTKLDACQGCYINNNWDYPPITPPPVPIDPQIMFTSYSCFTQLFTGLTGEEQAILHHLTEAFKLFIELDAKHPDDDDEFKEAIHAAQKMIALRVARRVDPYIWYQPESNQEQAD